LAFYYALGWIILQILRGSTAFATRHDAASFTAFPSCENQKKNHLRT
jgi:hypothetical protein